MSDEGTPAAVYRLKGTGIELTYRQSESKVDIKSEDDSLLTHDALDVVATAEPDLGLHLTATLLDSSRNGTRVMLTLLLPEVRLAAGTSADPEAITGVAIITRSFENLVGGAPPVLQSYDDVRRLEGTASPPD
jgi:hypothetical protein